ncbi:hypothetical protein ISE07_26110 [Pseudomonas aeruginosa]|uniref:hypothetical protein n=1 Tax=Pseudomonas aeruginosa TaxID=287 RepID=UPI001628B31C|nr:hypothetical protein [Pseudomonas aeruginosa]MBX5852221.1 hypothetical protein [Pseudomonas aeruginosa]QNE59454.1 hypothetical protein H5409_16560 [Pseudomonas aeruginosa]
MSHTPGPWVVVDGHYPSFIEIKGPSFGISVVTAALDLDFNDYMSRTADARLIAAAPELLEALQSCIQQITALCSADDVPDQARAAIAKATT